MNFDSYARRILSLNDQESVHSSKPQKQMQRRLQIKNRKMNMTTMRKFKFLRPNDKRFYFSDGIISLSFGNPYLSETRNYKVSKI